MNIPTIKSLITYTKINATSKDVTKVLCKFLKNDKYNTNHENIIANCPFKYDKAYHIEVNNLRDNMYEIIYYDYHEPMHNVYVQVESVLEFDDRIFDLSEKSYDIKEFENE